MTEADAPHRFPWRQILGFAIVLASLACAVVMKNRADKAEAFAAAHRNTAEGLRQELAELDPSRPDSLARRTLDLQDEVRALRKELEIARLTRELEKKTRDDESTADEADRKRLRELEERLKAAEELLARYRAEYGPVVPPPAPLRAKILAADNRMDIFLVSAGSDDGVRQGEELTVYRGEEFVAVVVVDKIFRDKASVAVKKEGGKEFKKSDIRQGDIVARVF